MSAPPAAVDDRVVIRRRLSVKTAPQNTQTPVQEFALGEEAPADSKLMLYLITLAYPKKTRSIDGYVLVASCMLECLCGALFVCSRLLA